MNRRNATSYFTLVELLVVIGIMVIIMGFTAPIFSKLSMGNAVDGGSRMVSTQLALARAEAISKRQYIAVVMPGSQFAKPAFNGVESQDDYNFRSLRAAIVTKGSSDNEYVFKSWFPGTEWTFLPKGAIIAEVDDDVQASSATVGTECTREIDSDGEVKVRSINANWLGDDRKLGYESNMTKVVDKTSGDMVNGKDNTSGVRAIIFKPNGQVAGGTRYVTIIEGAVDDSGADTNEYKLVNGNINNMRLLSIGQFTGKVVFMEPDYDKTLDTTTP